MNGMIAAAGCVLISGSSMVVSRYLESGIRRVGSRITAPGSEITSHGIGIGSFLTDQESGCTIFVG